MALPRTAEGIEEDGSSPRLGLVRYRVEEDDGDRAGAVVDVGVGVGFMDGVCVVVVGVPDRREDACRASSTRDRRVGKCSGVT